MNILNCGTPLSRISAYADVPPEKREEEKPALHRHVQKCEHCQNVLASVEAVGAWAGTLRQDTDDTPADPNWASEILSRLSLPVREGKTLVIAEDGGNHLGVTEALLRSLIRNRCSTDAVFVLGSKIRPSLDTDSAHTDGELASALELDCEVAVKYGCEIPPAMEGLRERVCDLVFEQTGVEVPLVNIDVIDVFKDEHEPAQI
ncbi:MAG: Asp23/Gls24 family envelope stress response protein [Actinomycetaceae bacterium]|nr:Asp23/Gls24 family envelope stress response protein [Actinomycetaceae bacterium]